MQKILFVCLGNICRSPAAEAIVAVKAPHLTVDSAGTGGWHVGEPPYAPMQEAARSRGYDLARLRARQFTAGDFDDFDLIIAMDESNLRDIETLRPEANGTPVRLMMSYAPQCEIQGVPDPYYTRDFAHTLDLIEQAADGIAATLKD